MATTVARFLLVVSRNYWGSSVSESTASAFARRFGALLRIPEVSVQHLVGAAVTPDAVRSALRGFVTQGLASAGEDRASTFYIYMNGHGTQQFDAEGDEALLPGADASDEAYMLPEGLLRDDDITSLLNGAICAGIRERRCPPPRRPLVVLISDHCCSGSMLDRSEETQNYDWISVGSSQDAQDSYASGQGHVMTGQLLEVLDAVAAQGPEALFDLTAAELQRHLGEAMRNSIVGGLQESSVHASAGAPLEALRPFGQ